VSVARSALESKSHSDRFRRALRDPGHTQAHVLRAILDRNAGCEYGRRHNFAAIRGVEDYRTRVPIVGYEEIRDDIERMADGAGSVLTQAPVIAFELTGGSGGAKLVPYTAAGLAEFQAGLLPWLAALRALVPDIDSGRAYWSISPACREPRRTAGGVSIGMTSDAAYFGERESSRLLASLAVPPGVGALRDVDQWRRATLLHLVACPDLVLISVWSPTFLLDLLDTLHRDAEEIGRDLVRATGTAPLCGVSREHVPAANPGRAEVLMRAAAASPFDWRMLWPRLSLVSCWDQARARPYAEQLRERLPGVRIQGKGLLATEGLVTIPWEEGADPVLALESGYFEFLDDVGKARGVDDLVVGGEYDLLLTTSSGLYRYAIGDRVRVTGWIERTPTLRFIGRSGVNCDLCGEKLDEAFVAGALTSAGRRFALLVPDRAPLGYALILDADESAALAPERAAAAVDLALRANPQYDHARRIGQLAPLRALRARNPLKSWIARGVARGQRLGDIKLAALYPQDDWRSQFEVLA